MTIFGRDSIFTSLQALPFTPELAATTLRALGDWQGTRLDDFRDEEPGRILHEMRYGEMTAFEERPHSPYYGAADATPLYVVLLDEYERWTGDTELVRELEARGARRAQLDRRVRRPPRQRLRRVRAPQRGDRPREPVLEGLVGLDLLRDGRLPAFPRATCEIQGYVYDAKMRGARLARLVWKRRGARRRARASRRPSSSAASTGTSGSRTASTSRSRSTPTGDQVDSLTSNIGHLLWSGIVDKSKAKAVARAPARADGSSRAGASARWPRARDATTRSATTSARSGRSTTRSSPGGCAATASRRRRRSSPPASWTRRQFFDGRLPEAFAGYARSVTKYPVQYPTACSPQAWSTGAPLLLLRTMLGLEPVGDHLVVDPALPAEHRAPRAARHPGTLGPRRRVRARARPGQAPAPRRGARPAARLDD